MTHEMQLSIRPFEKIVRGAKVIESRLYDEKRQAIKVGDRIEFTCTDNPAQKVSVQVIALHRHPSFDELFSAFLPEEFGGVSKSELLKEINTFYSEEEVKKYGVLGIHITLKK